MGLREFPVFLKRLYFSMFLQHIAFIYFMNITARSRVSLRLRISIHSQPLLQKHIRRIELKEISRFYTVLIRLYSRVNFP